MSAADRARQWLQSHELPKNAPAPRKALQLEARDDDIIPEKHGMTNSLSFEKLVIWGSEGFYLGDIYKVGTRIADADKAARRVMERDAAFHKWYSKVHEALKLVAGK